MRERNWQQYNKDLVQRGSLTFLIDPKCFKKLKATKKSTQPGRPEVFSDALIELLAYVKTHFKMTYRFLEGFAKSFLVRLISGLKWPTYSLICKRMAGVMSGLPPLARGSSSVVILDATGMKIIGEGEWKVKVHGRGRPRKWIKVHIGIDAMTQQIVAEITTESNVGDSKMTKPLLDQISGRIKKVIADGAYDKAAARRVIKDRKAQDLIPPPKNARYKGTKDERDKAILEIHGFGNDLEGRSLWGKLTGYSRRVLVETAISRFKKLFGDRFYSKTFKNQVVESRVRCLLINRMKIC